MTQYNDENKIGPSSERYQTYSEETKDFFRSKKNEINFYMNNADMYIQRGKIMYETKNYEQAVKYFNRAAELLEFKARLANFYKSVSLNELPNHEQQDCNLDEIKNLDYLSLVNLSEKLSGMNQCYKSDEYLHEKIITKVHDVNGRCKKKLSQLKNTTIVNAKKVNKPINYIRSTSSKNYTYLKKKLNIFDLIEDTNEQTQEKEPIFKNLSKYFTSKSPWNE